MILGNLPTYFLSLFKAPVAITEKLEQIRQSFLWGGDESNKKSIGCLGTKLFPLKLKVVWA